MTLPLYASDNRVCAHAHRGPWRSDIGRAPLPLRPPPPWCSDAEQDLLGMSLDTKNNLEDIFNQFDVTKDGNIDRNELKQALAKANKKVTDEQAGELFKCAPPEPNRAPALGVPCCGPAMLRRRPAVAQSIALALARAGRSTHARRRTP